MYVEQTPTSVIKGAQLTNTSVESVATPKINKSSKTQIHNTIDVTQRDM